MRLLLLLSAFISTSLALRADEPPPSLADSDAQPLPGHSSHGEAFNQGPRRQAVLLDPVLVGNIHFPISTKSTEAQSFFNQGVGQLHGFWYFEAERSFRQVALIDPNCAMAYWGLAMANVNNPKRAKEFIQKAAKLEAGVSPREKGWIEAFASFYADDKQDQKKRRGDLVKALENLSFENPDDIEIKAFLVLQIWDNSSHDMPIESHQAIDALARQVLEKQPMHPIHHYLIHLWNYQDDRRAIIDAALCGQSEPGIAHMWHMSGHTFTKLNRYADAAWQQEASARVDHADIMRWRIMPEEIHNYAHNNDWLIEDLSFIGRIHDAIDLARNMVELPRLAPKSELVGTSRYNEENSGYIHGERRLLQILPRFEMWRDLCDLNETMYLAPFRDSVEETRRLSKLGVAYFMIGDPAHGEEKLSAVEARLAEARRARYAAADEAEQKARKDKKSAEDISKAMADSMQKFAREIDDTESALAELRLYRAVATGDIDAAKNKLAEASNLPREQRVALEARLGSLDKAEETARGLVKNSEGQVLPLALLCDVLWKNDKKNEALENFRKLRELSPQADMDLPPFQRLAPLARDLNLSADWRPALKWPADSGTRPTLASLGPFRWQPYTAPDWNLFDREGHSHSLADYKGKPVLVMFYLGHGCTHCIEQLNLFAPEAAAFAKAGISMVALSSDAGEELTKTITQLKSSDDPPFPILANPTLGTFKAYHCYDEFESIPLHGTFLIDGSGLVRWQNISYEPFRDPKWLLGEATRLLALPKISIQAVASQ